MSRFIIASAWLLVLTAAAGAQNCPQPLGGSVPAEVPRDNVEENYVLHELDPQHPIARVGQSVFVCNPLANRVEAWGLTPLRLLVTIPVGLGPVSCHLEPGTANLWVVQYLSGAVSIVDLGLLAIVETIETGSGPQAMAFTDDGLHALVVCEQDRQVDIIDRATRNIVATVPIEGKKPCGITTAGGRAWVVPRLSGNNTTGLNPPNANAPNIRHLPSINPNKGVVPLPDIDVRVIDVDPASAGFATLVTSEEITACGTILFDVVHRANELLIPNTDALNIEVFGESNAVAGQVVRNRVTRLDLSTTPPTKSIIDLDVVDADPDPANDPDFRRFSQPTSTIWDQQTSRWYVFGEGNDTIAVFDQNLAYLGFWALPSTGGDQRHLPHDGLVVGDDLVVFCRASHGLVQIPTSTALGMTTSAPMPMFRPTPDIAGEGLSLLANADLSASGTTSCQSCHIFSGLDAVIWNLSKGKDPEGTPKNQVMFFSDEKGPMVTQDLRSLPETAPYHWRGEQENLAAFNGAFHDLMDGSVLSTPQFAKLEAYVNLLHYPANPIQQRDRSLTSTEQEGFELFLTADAEGPGQTCVNCHQLPLGTNGELQFIAGVPAGFAPATQVTQLRFVHDKELGFHDLGTDPTKLGGASGNCSLTGPGLSHGGQFADLLEFVDSFNGIDPATQDGEKITAFMQALDTGLAPSTASMVTLHKDNPNNQSDFEFFLAQADAGHCEVYATGYYLTANGGVLRPNFYYLPNSGIVTMSGGVVTSDTRQMIGENLSPPFPSPTDLVAAANRSGDISRWTVVGTPVGQAVRAIDLDFDGLLNGDEAIAATSPLDPDSDGDGFPDGHEASNGDDPVVAQSTSGDQTAPTIDSIATIYVTTNTVKIHVKTSERVKLAVDWVGLHGPERRVLPVVGHFDRNHDVVVNFLPPIAVTQVTLTATDPAGNATIMNHSLCATFPEVEEKWFVKNVTGSLQSITTAPGGNSVFYDFTVEVDVHENPSASFAVGAGHAVHAFAYFEDAGILSVHATDVTATTNASGRATFALTLVGDAASPPNMQGLCFGVTLVDPAPPSMERRYVEAFDEVGVVDFSF